MYLYPAFLAILTALSDSISAKLVMVSGLARFDSRRPLTCCTRTGDVTFRYVLVKLKCVNRS